MSIQKVKSEYKQAYCYKSDQENLNTLCHRFFFKIKHNPHSANHSICKSANYKRIITQGACDVKFYNNGLDNLLKLLNYSILHNVNYNSNNIIDEYANCC